MNILQINKYYYIVGGVSRYFFAVSKLLGEKGHNLSYFSMEDKKNLPTEYSRYFVKNVTFKKTNFFDSIIKLPRLIYSFEAKSKLSRLLYGFKPDIVHLHNIYHQISPSILTEMKKRGIPVVHTVGDYHLIAPNYNLFHNGKICEITKKDKFYKAIFHKCIKDSYGYSLVEVLEKYFNYYFGWERNLISRFIAPSRFMKNKLIEYGVKREKIIHLPHFVNSQEYLPDYELGNYVLYCGRLFSEKGLDMLIEVIKKLPAVKLLITGTGDYDYVNSLKGKCRKNKNIVFTGFLEGKKLKKIISGCRFAVLPSLWYEAFGQSILETFASGKPVIGSDIGGIPEIIIGGYNGLLFSPGNTDDLTEKIINLWSSPNLCRKMGINARNQVEKEYNPEIHYQKLMKVYQKTIDG